MLNYTYDNSGRLASSIDGNGNTTAYTYDNLGNITCITNPDGTTVTYTRDYDDNYVIVKDENNNRIKYTYSPLGLEYETIDVSTENVITRKEYDSCSRLIKYSEFVYGSVTEYTYDHLDRVTSETVKQDDTVLAQTLYEYEWAAENGAYNKVTKTVVGDSNAPSVVTTEYTDKHGNVVKTGRIVDGAEYFDTYTYDYVGNQTSILTAADAEKNLSFTAEYEYNHNGQIKKAYNAKNQHTANIYDSFGNLISTTDYAGTPTAYTYDVLGRLTSQTITVEGEVTSTSKYYYDSNGNIVEELTQNNAVGGSAEWAKTEYTYNIRNRLTSVKQYDNDTVASTTSYTYDGVGNVLTMTAGGKTTVYTHDRFGNILTETDALNQTESYSYSPLGRLESKTDRNGIVTTYGYDALGRTVSVAAQLGDTTETQTYTYTKTGQVLSEANGNGTTTYSYDEFGRVTAIDETAVGTSSASYIKTYSYDLADNRTGFTLEKSGETVHNVVYSYDNLNRLSTVSANGAIEAIYTYDTNGNRATLTLGNGVVTTYSYNLANWVTNLSNKNSDGDILSSYSYEYYVSGSQKSKTDNGVVTNYVYDDLGKLTSESEANGVTLSYTYDSAGNRSKLTATGTESYVVDYTYDNANRLLTEVKTVGNTTETTTYTYDANGNTLSVTSPGNLQANEYNLFNQLVYSNINGNYAAYFYNTAGIRTAKSVNGTSTSFLLDGGNVVGEVQNGDITATYLRGTNILSTSTEDNTSYYVFNAHGDVTGITNDAQAVSKTYDYDAFGNEKNPSITDENPFRYCGEYYDAETGTYYLRARYYDPSIGRFTQQDTHWNTANMIYGDNPNKINECEDVLGLKTYTYTPSIGSIMQSGNLYVYCVNNPIYYCDYNGHWIETAFDIATLGVSIAEAVNDPTNGWLWIGVAADAVDLLPFVTGLGEITRAARITDNIVDSADTVIDGVKIQKATDFTTDAKEKINNLQKIDGFTRSNRSDGIAIHSGYKTKYNDLMMHKEYSYKYANGKVRLDFYDEKNNIIYELKPNNPKAIKAGIKQIKNYNKILGKNSTLILELY